MVTHHCVHCNEKEAEERGDGKAVRPKDPGEKVQCMQWDENIDKEHALKGKDKEMGPWLVKADVR